MRPLYTNFYSNFTSGIIHFSLSDHLSVFINFPVDTQVHKTYKYKLRSFSETNKQQFSNKISTIDWYTLLSEVNLNDNFEIFISKLKETYNKCFPILTKTTSEKRLITPWINQEVINAIKIKNKLYKDFKIGAVPEEQYKHYRNALNNDIKQLKQTYYMNLFIRFKNDTTKMWKIINQLSRKSLKNKNIEHIIDNNTKISRTSDIAELLISSLLTLPSN